MEVRYSVRYKNNNYRYPTTEFKEYKRKSSINNLVGAGHDLEEVMQITWINNRDYPEFKNITNQF